MSWDLSSDLPLNKSFNDICGFSGVKFSSFGAQGISGVSSQMEGPLISGL